MKVTHNAISKLYDADADKANQLWKNLAKGTPKAARIILKTTSNLTNQLLFVVNGTIGVLTFPLLTTDEQNKLRLIGTYGDEIDNLAPTAIQGELLQQSVSALMPKALATKYDLPVLAADILVNYPRTSLVPRIVHVIASCITCHSLLVHYSLVSGPRSS
jgi:hypothetical protein